MKFVIVWGEIQNLGGGGGGGIPPPKGPEKNTALSLQWPYQSKIAGSGPDIWYAF